MCLTSRNACLCRQFCLLQPEPDRVLLVLYQISCENSWTVNRNPAEFPPRANLTMVLLGKGKVRGFFPLFCLSNARSLYDSDLQYCALSAIWVQFPDADVSVSGFVVLISVRDNPGDAPTFPEHENPHLAVGVPSNLAMPGRF